MVLGAKTLWDFIDLVATLLPFPLTFEVVFDGSRWFSGVQGGSTVGSGSSVGCSRRNYVVLQWFQGVLVVVLGSFGW